jgi:ribonuclease P/MRP protein subunit RPP1
MKMNVIIDKGFEKIRKKVLDSDSKPIIYSSDDDDLNRRVMEKLKIDVLLLSQKNRKDFSKQRNSGLNHVLAKIAKKNDIGIGIDLDEIIEASGFGLAEILSRVRQNIFLCNKAKVQMKFIAREKKNSRNIYDLRSLGLVLGMPTWMTKRL